MDNWIKTVEQLLAANNGVDMQHASTSELYRAVSRATMAEIADTWQKCKDAPKKRVGYLSAEFLVGRAIFANLYNLGKLDEVRDIMAEHGVDSLVGRTAAVMLGSTETTFYTISVYFGAAGIKKTRYAIPAALTADLTGFIIASLTTRWFL